MSKKSQNSLIVPYFDDYAEFLSRRSVNRFDLMHLTRIGVNSKIITVRFWYATDEWVSYGRIDGVHIDGLDFFGRNVENALEYATGNLEVEKIIKFERFLLTL